MCTLVCDVAATFSEVWEREVSRLLPVVSLKRDTHDGAWYGDKVEADVDIAVSVTGVGKEDVLEESSAVDGGKDVRLS